MVQLTLDDQQVLDLIQRLPTPLKRRALKELSTAAAAASQTRRQHIESSLRELAAQRGLDWDQLDDERREKLVDDLIHEERNKEQ